MGDDPLGRVAALPGVFEAVEAARGSVDRLLRELRGAPLRRRITEVTAESVRVAAWASAALEGRVGALADYRAPVPDRLGRNSLRLQVELADLGRTWPAAPGQALARMHVLAATDLEPVHRLGRPDGPAAATRLETMIQVIGQPTTAPAVVVAAVVHGELLAERTFGVGSGLVARAASRCVLVSRGLDPRAASVPERGHLELGAQAYEAALAGYRSGSVEGVAEWVSHCAQAIALGGRAGSRIASALLAERHDAGGAPSDRGTAR